MASKGPLSPKSRCSSRPRSRSRRARSRSLHIAHHLRGPLPSKAVQKERRHEKNRRKLYLSRRDQGAAYIVISPGPSQQPGVVPAAGTRQRLVPSDIALLAAPFRFRLCLTISPTCPLCLPQAPAWFPFVFQVLQAPNWFMENSSNLVCLPRTPPYTPLSKFPHPQAEGSPDPCAHAIHHAHRSTALSGMSMSNSHRSTSVYIPTSGPPSPTPPPSSRVWYLSTCIAAAWNTGTNPKRIAIPTPAAVFSSESTQFLGRLASHQSSTNTARWNPERKDPRQGLPDRIRTGLDDPPVGDQVCWANARPSPLARTSLVALGGTHSPWRAVPLPSIPCVATFAALWAPRGNPMDSRYRQDQYIVLATCLARRGYTLADVASVVEHSLAHAGRLRLRLKLSSRCCRQTSKDMGEGSSCRRFPCR
ncbi:hypothetical protein B0T14DRAFT_220656 [Immersiella caudata]|uniref:Uncharacterized protein n=1 Tax=Immersiella caudata TaxID=314043 RepID=A0AA39WR04_9PEZI|nr:hypothetical protein B0T14DRAFT_220656 [Immersiella caudata]